MLHAKFQNHRAFRSAEKVFFNVFAIYSHGGHLGHVTWTIYSNFRSAVLRMLHMTFGYDWPNVFKEEESLKTLDVDGRSPDANIFCKLTCERSAQVSYNTVGSTLHT